MSERKPCKSCGNLGVTYEVEPTDHPDFERVFSFCPECGRMRGNWVRSNTDRKGHPRTVAVPVDGVARIPDPGLTREESESLLDAAQYPAISHNPSDPPDEATLVCPARSGLAKLRAALKDGEER